MRTRISSVTFDNKQMIMIYDAIVDKRHRLLEMYRQNPDEHHHTMGDEVKEMESILQRFQKGSLVPVSKETFNPLIPTTK